MSEYDIIIIGAGPAGASAAVTAAEDGWSVLMIDRRMCIGEPVQCAEYIPLIFLRELPAIGNAVIQKTSAMRTIYPSGKEISTQAPGVMIDRAKFDQQLAMNAIRQGAELMLETEVIQREKNCITIKHKNKTSTLSAGIIIGADGPKSIIERSINSKKRKYVIGYQCQTPLTDKMEVTEVYFKPEFYGGYGWVFPKNDIANVGIGVLPKSPDGSKLNLRYLLNGFMDQLARSGRIINTPLSYVSGLIPCDGPVPQTISENVLLVGDAAGHTHPITGGGIPQAVLCGNLAGKVAAQTLKSGDPVLLTKYDTLWRNRWGMELDRARRRRSELEKNWNELETSLDRCWVTSRKYYEP